MKKRKPNLSKHAQICYIGFAVFVLPLLGGCHSGGVRTEAAMDDFTIKSNAKFVIENVDAGPEDLEFGPKAQEIASNVLKSSIEFRNAMLVSNVSDSDYILKFGTFTEKDEDYIASVFPSSQATVYSHPRGLSTPLGALGTGRDNTYVVHESLGAAVIDFEDSDRVFVVDILDSKSNELLWRGYTRDKSESLSEERIEIEIRKIVETIPLAESSQSITEATDA